MKKTATKAKKLRDTMRPEYDFSNAVRGKYARSAAAVSNIVVLDPDIAARFKNTRAVNAALRALLKAADQTQT
jgi:hypothetical protein